MMKLTCEHGARPIDLDNVVEVFWAATFVSARVTWLLAIDQPIRKPVMAYILEMPFNTISREFSESSLA